MKGIVFTEFLELVEEKFGFETANEIVVNANLPSGGTYTAIGTYEHSEMVALVVGLSQREGVPVPDLLRVFGEHLFTRFHALYPVFFEKVNDAFTFFESIDYYIHREVLKLYPDAELPSFKTERKGDSELIMHYSSERKMADFAHGLIMGGLKHFDEEANVSMENANPEGTKVIFSIKRT